MKEKEDWFSKFFNFILKYYLILSLVPLLLGGLHQFWNLWRIGKQYLRFFSATQLLVDGLILLIYLIVILICLYLYSFFHRAYSPRFYDFVGDYYRKMNEEIKFRKRKKQNFWTANILSFLIILIATFINFPEIKIFSKNLFHFFIRIFYGEFNSFNIGLDLWLLLIFVSFVIIGNFNFFNEKVSINGTFSELYLYLITAPFSLIAVNLFFVGTISFTNIDQIGNSQNFEEYILDTNPKYGDIKILYNNDKYIFSS